MSDNAFPDALPPQYKLHWYVIERVLGQGGFGITYLARDTNLDQSVAIKEYLPVEVATRRSDSTVGSRTDEHQERYRWGLERFIREARTLARFDHPNIVRVLSVFELNSTAYMVMRFEEGETLAALLERKHALGEADLLRVLLPILDGLELVHNAGFIHRDIKPDNIHIRSDGSPVLLDFGSARYAVGHSRTVTILVAPGYAPFEQYYSSGESQGPWTDVYSLGATCYRAIAGRAPLDAIARSKGILGSTQELLVPATAVGSGRYSERLLKAIDHALAFAEKDRPQSIAEWRKELSGELALRTRSAPPAAAAAQPIAPPRPGPRTALGPLAWGAAGAVVVLAALGALPWLLPARPQPSVQAEPAPAQTEALRRLSALEEKLADEQQKLAEERKRFAEVAQKAESDRKRLDEPPAPKPAPAARARSDTPRQIGRVSPAPSTPIAPKLVPPAESASPPAAPAPTPAVAAAPSPLLASAAPQPSAPEPKPASGPSVAELIAEAERSLDRAQYAEAAAKLRPLAERGNTKAQLYMGELYAKGQGVPQNNFHAYVWYSAAAVNGSEAAKAEKQRLAALLQPAERQQAERLAERVGRSR